jgi:predicted porin
MTSRIGFKGGKQLAGDVSVGFVFEAQVFADSGDGQATNTNNTTTGTVAPALANNGLSFARRSTVSLTNSLGELRLGRDFSAHYRNRVEVDPFGNAGVGAILPFTSSIGGLTSTRASNMIGYYLPVAPTGLYGQIQHYMGEGSSGTATASDGSGTSARFGYVVGPLNISVATAVTKYAASATTGNTHSTNLAVRYAFERFQFMAGTYKDVVERSTTPQEAKGYTYGGIFTQGANDIKLALSKYSTGLTAANPSASKISLGYVRNIDKDVALYATFARLTNTNTSTLGLNGSTAAADTKTTGFDAGVRYSF